jgi:hypothetical protein
MSGPTFCLFTQRLNYDWFYGRSWLKASIKSWLLDKGVQENQLVFKEKCAWKITCRAQPGRYDA